MTDPTKETERAGPTGSRSGEEPFGKPGRGESSPEAHDAVRETREAGQQVAGAARDIVEQQRGSLANGVSGVASALHHAASKLEEEKHDVIAHYAREAGNAFGRTSTELRSRDTQSLLEQASRFGREHPEIILAGAVTAGFFLARVTRAAGQQMSSAWEEETPFEEEEGAHEPRTGTEREASRPDEEQGFTTH